MKRLLSAMVLLSVASPVLAAEGEAADGEFSLTAGIQYTTGKYGNAAATDILYIPVTGQYQSGNLTLWLTVPYISVTGPGGVIQGFGRVASPTGTAAGMPKFGRAAPGATLTNSGLGDVITAAGYTVYSGDKFSVDAVGKIKFGTADADKGLGTGKNDYAAQLDGYYALAADTTLLVTGGYKIVGAPDGIATNNVPYGMLGLDEKVGEVSSVGVMYNAAKSVAPGIPGQRDVTLYASKELSPTFTVRVNVLKGFSDASPDYGGGLMVTGYF